MSDITVWSKPKCVQCTAVKRAFDRAGVEYESLELPEHPEALAAFIRAGFTSAPIVEAAGFETFAGYDPEKVRAIIDAHRFEDAV